MTSVMMTIFNTYMRSKLDYCSTIWLPRTQAEINTLVAIRKYFTSKIDGIRKEEIMMRALVI